MARKRRNQAKPAVNLPPFPWETEVALPGGGRARLARPDIEEADIDLDCTQGADGEVVVRRARVWRTRLPPVLRILNPAARAALLDYTEAVEAVGASGGTSDPTGGRGGGTGARGPSLRALAAAERLRHMNAALAGGVLAVPVKDAKRLRRGDGVACVGLRQLAEWLAVDGMSRDDILIRAGAAPSNEAAQDAATLAIVEVGTRLAICCGYVAGATGGANIHATRRGRDV